MDTLHPLVEEDALTFTVSGFIPKGTKLLTVPTEVTLFCEDWGRCLNSSADHRFLMVTDFLLPPSRTFVDDHGAGPFTLQEARELLQRILDDIPVAVDAATTTLERDAQGVFWACAARDLVEGNELTRYARVHEQLQPLLTMHLEQEWMRSAVYIESVIAAAMSVELEVMRQRAMSVFGPVHYPRGLPIAIDIDDDGNLICPFENQKTPTDAECAVFLKTVYGEDVPQNAREELYERLLE
jgi:hypothetical protein